MIDPFSLAMGGGLLGAGILIGRTMQARPPKPPALMCTCGHGYGQHDDGGKCAAEEERTLRGSGYSILGTEWAPCACRSYDGPEPLPRAWTP